MQQHILLTLQLICCISLLLPFVMIIMFTLVKNNYCTIFYTMPNSAIERELLKSKIYGHLRRMYVLLWNVSITTALYAYSSATYNTAIFHCIQLITIILLYTVGLMNPGRIKVKQALFEDLDEEQESLVRPKDLNDFKAKFATYGYIRMFVENAENISIPTAIKTLCSKYVSFDNTVQINWDEDEGENVPSAFCWRCTMIRPFRSKHCYDCDACVARFDHHDVHIGNCVGVRNHRYYLLWIIVGCICYNWSLVMLFDLMINNSSVLNIFGWILIVFLSLVVSFLAITRIILLLLQICFISQNKTVYEVLKPQVLIRALTENYYQPQQNQSMELDTMTEEEKMYFEKYYDAGFVRNWKNFLGGYKMDTYLFGNDIICKL
eukprot:126146_1